MADPNSYFIDLSGKPRPNRFKLEETVYSKVDWFNQSRSSKRVFDPVMGIEGMVIHATAGGNTSGAIGHWETPGIQASAHWIVPDEDEPEHGRSALAVVYESRAAWHVNNAATSPKVGNKLRINHWTLGVEVVNRQDGVDAFSDWQVDFTALMVRYAWAKYPNFRYVFSHAMVDPGRRSDPGKMFDWARFTDKVLSGANDPQNLPIR